MEIDTQIRHIRNKAPLEDDDLRLQRLVWMCDANQSVIAELIAIIGSSLVQVLMQRHALAFAFGYEPGVALDIPTVFVQMMVELLEMVVDSTVMWAEGEHGIPITRYFEHVRSLYVAAFHASYAVLAVVWVSFSFIRFPTVATCAESSSVCVAPHGWTGSIGQSGESIPRLAPSDWLPPTCRSWRARAGRGAFPWPA